MFAGHALAAVAKRREGRRRRERRAAMGAWPWGTQGGPSPEPRGTSGGPFRRVTGWRWVLITVTSALSRRAGACAHPHGFVACRGARPCVTVAALGAHTRGFRAPQGVCPRGTWVPLGAPHGIWAPLGAPHGIWTPLGAPRASPGVPTAQHRDTRGARAAGLFARCHAGRSLSPSPRSVLAYDLEGRSCSGGEEPRHPPSPSTMAPGTLVHQSPDPAPRNPGTPAPSTPLSWHPGP